MTKTDLARYVRCPYAFWLLDSGQISHEETISEQDSQLLQAGNDFEVRVQATLPSVQLRPTGLKTLLRGDARLLGTPLFRNRRLRFCGQPDGIDTANGALVPIEVKAHKSVQRLDELELAFYWLLLEPWRTVPDAQPRGVLILQRDGLPVVTEVPIPQHRLDEVLRLTAELRQARRTGVRPRVCGCHICSVTRREEVLTAVQASQDLSMIFGIGRSRAAMLEAAGITTWADLLSVEPEELAAITRAGLREAEQWQMHAGSYESGSMVGPSAKLPASDSFIALDLEYGSHIWLAGACVVTAAARDYAAFWADGADEELLILDAVASLLRQHPGLPVLTWAGHCADLPVLQAALTRNPSARQAMAELFRRHTDMYVFARDNVRLPIPSMALKEVASYFGIPRISDIDGGFQAQSLYAHYQRTGDVSLRARLTDYNRDDLDALIGVTQELSRAARDLRQALDTGEILTA